MITTTVDDTSGGVGLQRMVSPLGVDLFGQPITAMSASKLANDWGGAPPFSVLSARDSAWQERKAGWISYGIESEIGRNVSGKNCTSGKNTCMLDGEGEAISIFDPVLCELAYKWWSPPGCQIVDPFAGGSVRGVVASMLGRSYWGSELREEQVAANCAQAAKICSANRPQYVCGDSMETLENAPVADFVFSCPPYGDLERYSDNPMDLSTMEYHTFIPAYKRIILRCFQKLKKDSFACFVVGDFRDTKTGNYRGFIADTVNAFREVGMELYNDAVLLTPTGSLPARVGRQFRGGRKLGKAHQNILLFVKGDGKRAAARCGDFEG